MLDAISSPAARTRALAYYFGLTDPTIDDIVNATGVPADTILSAPLAQTSYIGHARGWFAVRTCDEKWRRDTLAAQNQGDWSYWSGVIEAFWITGALDDPTATAA